MSHKAVSNEQLFLGDSETAAGPATEPKHCEAVPSGNLIDDSARADSGKHRIPDIADIADIAGEPSGPGNDNGQLATTPPHDPVDPKQSTDEAKIP